MGAGLTHWVGSPFPRQGVSSHGQLDLRNAVTAGAISDFFFAWYPVFGVLFMAGLLCVFALLLRQTMRSTKPETIRSGALG